MADPRFFENAGPLPLGVLAMRMEATLADGANPALEIADVAPLDVAGSRDLSFLDNKRYVDSFRQSNAAACIVEPEFAEQAPEGMALVISKTPYRAFALAARALYPDKPLRPGIHPSAVVARTAKVASDARIEAGAVVGDGVVIGSGVVVGANAVVGDHVEVGPQTHIGANASLSHCTVGARVNLHPGVRIGNRGFGFAMDAGGAIDVPQLGRVIVEDDVEIGANATVDRGAGPDTLIGAGAKIDNLVQIGHNVVIGRGSVIVAQAGVAGSSQLGEGVVLAAQGGIAGHLTIGSGAQIGAQAGVMRDVEPGAKVIGSPAIPVKRFWRLQAVLGRLLDGKTRKGQVDS